MALSCSTKSVTLCALFGLAGSALIPPVPASAAPSGGDPFAPGSVVIAQGGTIAGAAGSGKGTTVKQNGEVEFYPPNSNGDVAPEASFTKDMYGPTDMAFDPSGDLWVANINVPTLVELTRPSSPCPTRCRPWSSRQRPIRSTSSPISLSTARATCGSSVAMRAGYEYAKPQLATSGKPKPIATISDLPSAPLGEAFDSGGNLWVTTVTTTGKPCPSGCVVESQRRTWPWLTQRPRSSSLRLVASTWPSQHQGTCGWSPGAPAQTAVSALPAPTSWWSSRRPSSQHRAPLRLLSGSVPRRPGLYGDPTASPSAHKAIYGSPTSTNPPQSNTAKASFPALGGRPLPCGPSWARRPG